MAISRGPKLVTNGLTLALDAGDTNSYRGVEVLIVAGGGSGGVDNGGGGGGGGVVYAGISPTPSTNYSIVIGAGGAARSGASDDGPGNNGANSTAFGYTAIGGSGGTGWVNPALPPGSASYTGGSGGGQSTSTGGVNSVGAGTATSGQGYPGGTAVAAYSGGGGGAGGAGGNATAGSVGAGGEGFYVGDLFGSLAGVGGYVAGGGAGGFDYVTGSRSTLPFTRNGTTKKLTETGEDACPNNTGAGGNGANHDNENSGGGGSGVVFVRYYGPQRATGGTIYTFNGYTVHRFNSNGTFNLTTAANWLDISGNNNNGTLTYSPTYSIQNRGSLVFDGTDDYVDVANASSLNPSNGISVSVWVKFTSTINNTRQMLVEKHTSPGFGWWLAGQNNKIVWLIVGTINGEKYIDLTNNTSIISGIIYNIVGTYNATSSTLKLYVNGSDDGGTIIGGGSGLSSSLNPLIIGKQHNWGNSPSSITMFNTLLYNRALSATEVFQNYNATKSRFGL